MEPRLRATPTALIALVAAAALLLAAGVARAEPSDDPRAMSVQARKHLELGLTYYQAKDYEDAIREFGAGYALDPRPQFLFAIAQAERLSGDCASAIVAYEKFLETSPPEQQADAARESVERCRIALSSRIRREADDEGGPAAAEPAGSPATTMADSPGPAAAPHRAVAATVSADADGLRRPWYRDKVGASLLGAGVATAAIGIGFYAASASDEAAADSAPTYGEYQDLIDRAESRRKVAWLGIATGTALIGGAAIWYLVRNDERDRDRPAVGMAVTSDGAAVFYAAEF